MTTDTTVWCNSCMREQHVSFAHCLANGWPLCCGETMALKETPPMPVIREAVAHLPRVVQNTTSSLIGGIDAVRRQDTARDA